MHVAFVTSEMVPYVKTGGLADVSGALPKALVKLGHRVTVVLPRYRQIAFPPGDFAGSVHVPVDAISRSAGFYRTLRDDGVEVVFVEHPPFFDRDALYGEYTDNHLRFAFLARAALEYFRSRAERPDVFHAHDWQTGLLSVYLKAFYWDDPTLYRSPSIFTIHNVAYQGVFASDALASLGLPWHLGAQAALEFHGNLSYLKGGVQFSELVNTVSPTYAHEIQGREHGFGFEGVLQTRASDLSGILNGVRLRRVGPGRRLAHRPEVLGQGPRGQEGLQGRPPAHLRPARVPRPARGGDHLAARVAEGLRHRGGCVVRPSAASDADGGARHRRALRPGRLARPRAEGSRPVRDAFSLRRGLAHKIMAGSDIFLMPSRSEPCGLTQLYALRYGAVPVVRSTGGLVDTVEPWNAGTGEGTGFRFDSPDGTGLMWAIDQALAAHKDKKSWPRLVRNGMSRDFSWERSARRYVELYERARQMA